MNLHVNTKSAVLSMLVDSPRFIMNLNCFLYLSAWLGLCSAQFAQEYSYMAGNVSIVDGSLPTIVQLSSSTINLPSVHTVKLRKSKLLSFGIYIGLYEGNSASDGGCGKVDVPSIMAMEATRWTIDLINKAEILPFTVGFQGYRTCGNLNTAGDIANSIAYNSKTSNTSVDRIIGVIGPKYSSETEVVSRILSNQLPENRILQLGFSATAESLDNKGAFPNFYRVIPDDRIQVRTMVQLMTSLQWNRIAIVFENDTYGRGAASELRVEAMKHHMCISEFAAITVDSSRDVSIDQINQILDNIVIERTKIGAIVYIGNRDVANQLLLVTDTKAYRDVPIFVMPETIQLQMGTFKKSDGTTFTKSLGTLLTSVPYDEIISFKSYWISLFSNKSALVETLKFNPFLKEVFEDITGNSLEESSQAPSVSQLNSLFIMQPTYVRYIVMAVHTMVGTLRKVYDADTEDFFSNFSPSRMLEAINSLTLSFPDDFVPGITNSGNSLTLKFTSESANPSFDANDVVYEAYNFIESSNGANIFRKIGEVTNGSLRLNTANILDYDENGNEQQYPNGRKGQCEVDGVCTECMLSDITQAIFHIPGDVYVIGIASIHNKAIGTPQGCGTIRTRHGFQMVLAMQFGLKTFLSSDVYRPFREKFGNKTVGLLVLNSCNNPLEIDRKLLNVEANGVVLENGQLVDLTNRILGYIGGQATDVSEPVAVQLTRLGIVQISYSSTNPVLSDQTKYPYFMRIVPPDNVQATAMIDVVQDLGGEYIQLIYSEGQYGEGGRDQVTQAARSKGICIAQMLKVAENSEYNEYYELMRQKPHAKVVIIFLRSHVVGTFMKNVNDRMKPGEFQFIGSEAWAKNEEVLQYDQIKGAITMSLQMEKSEALDEFIRNQTPSWGVTHPWLEEYLQHRQNCYFPWSFNKKFSTSCSDSTLPVSDANFESDPWCIYVSNTILSFLKGASVFHQQKCGSDLGSELCPDYLRDPAGLVEQMKKVTLNTLGTGDIQIYDEKGDGRMGYKIYNIRLTEDLSKRDYVEVGSYAMSSELTFHKDKVRYPTDAIIESVCPNEQACSMCRETADEPDTQEKKMSVAIPVLGSLVGVCLLVIATFLYCTFSRRSKKEDTYITPTETERTSGDGTIDHDMFDLTDQPDPPYHQQS